MSQTSMTNQITCAPSRWRRSLLTVFAIAGLGVVAAMPNSGAAAPPPNLGSCPASHNRAINGTTANGTNIPLTRVYLEEGFGSTWEHKPAEVVKPGKLDKWCNLSNPFPFTTAAVKMEYALGGGVKMVIEAFIAFFGAAEEKCFVTGPEPSEFKCRANRFDKTSRELFASFHIER